jgi:LPXTG-site transpeptidase (sortase) family protein
MIAGLHEQAENMVSMKSTSLERNILFALVFLGTLSLTYGALFVVDFLPEAPKQALVVEDATESDLHDEERIPAMQIELPATSSANTETVADAEVTPQGISSKPIVRDVRPVSVPDTDKVSDVDPYPVSITFDTLEGRTVRVLNPESRSVEALDTALLSGVVRHPDSADFARTGTIFLFGHSSYLPNVLNKNFQAFNGIQKLTWGDTIRLRSSDTEYVYRVDRVYELSADSGEIPIQEGSAKLTLVTCDSFGAKSDRFVLEATRIDTVPL